MADMHPKKPLNTVEQIKNGLVVSCQAWPDSPLYGPVYMLAMAKAAEKGGAVGLRVNGVEDIHAVHQDVPLPIIGIYKFFDPGGTIWMTPTYQEAFVISEAGAGIIAVDGIHLKRTDGTSLEDLIQKIHLHLGKPVMVDVSTLEEGARAQTLGADLVATTFSVTRLNQKTPDYKLLRNLVNTLTIPIVAEGLYWTPDQVCKAFQLGAHSVVVGTAITRPDEITQRFVTEINEYFSRRHGPRE
jgi:N-acylglucosamine-6-phosphate 2-epimerase